MAPPHSLKHLAIRALNATSLHIGARVGNFYATGSNYSCTPLELTYSHAVPPISIGVVNGSFLDVPSFWSSPSDSVLNVSTLEHIATINTGDHGDLSWDVDVDVGSYIAFKAEDASGAIAYSQLRTVYYGGASDKECSALAPFPPYTTPGPRVGARAGNLYSASSPLAPANCSDVEINYDGLSPPHAIDLINASTSLLPVGSAFFDSLAPSSNFNVSVIKQLGVRNYTMGYVYWTIGEEAPVGSRVAWRITDSTGAVGFSEVRTVYAASDASKNACAAHNPLTFSDSSPTSRSPFSNRAVQFGLFCAGVIGLIFLFLLVCFCVGFWTATAGPRARPAGAAGAVGDVPMAEVGRRQAEAEEEEDERETHRPRQADEEELPTYAAALSAARKEGPRGAAA